MVRKYTHYSSEHLAEYMDRLSGLKAVENVSGEMATLERRRSQGVFHN